MLPARSDWISGPVPPSALITKTMKNIVNENLWKNVVE